MMTRSLTVAFLSLAFAGPAIAGQPTKQRDLRLDISKGWESRTAVTGAGVSCRKTGPGVHKCECRAGYSRQDASAGAPTCVRAQRGSAGGAADAPARRQANGKKLNGKKLNGKNVNGAAVNDAAAGGAVGVAGCRQALGGAPSANWNAYDGTCQETSDGRCQCGPALSGPSGATVKRDVPGGKKGNVSTGWDLEKNKKK